MVGVFFFFILAMSNIGQKRNLERIKILNLTKMKKIIYGLVIISFVGVGCRKEKQNILPILNENNANKISSNLVTYNSTHDVLIFPTFNDLSLVANQILASQNDYNFDQGNQTALLTYLQNIISTPSLYSLDGIHQSLINSYPLSDTVLNTLISVSSTQSDTSKFYIIEDILISNTPLAPTILTNVTTSTLTSKNKNAIIAAENNQTLDKKYAFNDFLNQFPAFNSLWTARRINEEILLENGVSPNNPQFDYGVLKMEIEQLFFNEEFEIYIEGMLFKLYSDCRMAIINKNIDGAYAELALLDNNGMSIPPTPFETNSGIPLASMEAVFPINTVLTNVDFYSPEFNTAQDYNSILEDDCPQSAFTYSTFYDGLDYNNIQFTNLTPESFEGTFYQYWTFGDGTGSFQLNPIHKYASTGTYNVRLTTFNADCGCWDVITQTVTVKSLMRPPVQYCDVSFSYFPEAPGSNTYVFSIDASSYTEPFAAINIVNWDFGDGSPYGTGLTVSHTYESTEEIEVTMIVEFDPVEGLDGCINSFSLKINDIGAANVCDRYDKFKSEFEPLFGGDYAAKVESRFNGYTLEGLIGGRIKAQTEFFKKKPNGSWRRIKAEMIHVEYDATIQYLDESGNCSITEELDKSESKPNESGCFIWSPASVDPFGSEPEAVKSLHRVKFNGIWSPIKYIIH